MKKVTLVALIFAVVASGCSWFQSPSAPATTKTDTSVTTPPAPATSDDRLALCNVAPTPREIGDNQYPVAKKYEKLSRLGQLFTAAPCDTARLNAVFKEVYLGYGQGIVIGEQLTLNTNPTADLITTFKNIGYACSDSSSDASCKTWKLDKPVDANALLQLEPYTESFASDTCLNCG